VVAILQCAHCGRACAVALSATDAGPLVGCRCGALWLVDVRAGDAAARALPCRVARSSPTAVPAELVCVAGAGRAVLGMLADGALLHADHRSGSAAETLVQLHVGPGRCGDAAVSVRVLACTDRARAVLTSAGVASLHLVRSGCLPCLARTLLCACSPSLGCLEKVRLPLVRFAHAAVSTRISRSDATPMFVHRGHGTRCLAHMWHPAADWTLLSAAASGYVHAWAIARRLRDDS
jgi:hypothetical protein